MSIITTMYEREFLSLAFSEAIIPDETNGIDDFIDAKKQLNLPELSNMLKLTFRKNFRNDKILAAILYAVSRLPKPLDLDIILIPMLASQHDDDEIRLMCIKCFETWADKPSMFYRSHPLDKRAQSAGHRYDSNQFGPGCC